MTEDELLQASSAVKAGIEAGWLRPQIWRELPLEKAGDAQDLLSRGGGALGKVVLLTK